MRLPFTCLFLLVFSFVLPAQTSKDATVPISATTSYTPSGITLNWVNPGNASILIQRRKKGLGGLAWQQVLNQSNTNLTAFVDNAVLDGQIYEYQIRRTISNLVAYGYVHVALHAPVVDSRGKILIFVDSTTADALSVEIERLRNDLRGDGWIPISFQTGPSSTVQSVKDQIVTTYNADPSNVKSVLLLGTVPIPYSGNFAWDGHTPDHTGAWPADTYYADVNGVWTDVDIENTQAGRDANDNIPGDGKFDQSYLPSAVELQVGRVDFRHINAVAFGEADQNGLMRRYLDKNHRWRVGEYQVENKALVDDNFGYFSGEAFASNGYRNAYPLVGEANIVEADFFENTNPQTYLLGYGCGGGNYNGAGGVGSSSNFATDTVNIVFSNVFGSYFGDWGYENDPFMPSALASRGGILTCSWAGRPHWYNQALASGETIGYCAKETMNSNGNSGFYNSTGRGGAHVALLGDPSLRAHIIKPATDLVLTSACNKVKLSWTASADSVAGYYVYRAPSKDGPYTALNTNLISGTSYTDNNPSVGTLYYQVRAIKSMNAPGGGIYVNNSVGVIQEIVFAESTLMGWFDIASVNCDGSAQICASGSGGVPPYSVLWSNGSTQNCTSYNLPGVVSLTLTDAAGCNFHTNEITVSGPPPIVLTVIIVNESAPNAHNGSLDLTVNGGVAPNVYVWSTGATTQDLTGLSGGTYTCTVTDLNGCTQTISATITTPSSTDESLVFQQFLLSPNPSKGLANLSVKLHKSATLRIEIRDLAGRLVWEKPVVETDHLNLSIDLTNSPAGMYTLSVLFDNQVFVRKLAIVKE